MPDTLWDRLYDRRGVTADGFASTYGDPLCREAADALMALKAENERYRKTLRQVEDWWLRDGGKHFDGAPACIFSVRAVLHRDSDTRPKDGDGTAPLASSAGREASPEQGSPPPPEHPRSG